MVNGLPDATRVLFDDERVVANAGVLLPAVSLSGSGSRVWSMGWLISVIGKARRTRGAR